MDAHGGHDDPGNAHAHDAGHGDPHAHGVKGDPAAVAHGGGPAEMPPVPAVRSIAPAASDYEQPWPGAGLLWPVVWFGVALLLYTAAGRTAKPIEAHGEGAAEHVAPSH